MTPSVKEPSAEIAPDVMWVKFMSDVYGNLIIEDWSSEEADGVEYIRVDRSAQAPEPEVDLGRVRDAIRIMLGCIPDYEEGDIENPSAAQTRNVAKKMGKEALSLLPAAKKGLREAALDALNKRWESLTYDDYSLIHDAITAYDSVEG